MRGSPLRRAASSWAVLSICALLLGSGVVGSTFAIFSAETTNKDSAYAVGWLGAPTGGSVTAQGYDVGFAWTPTTTGPITGQSLYGVDNGTSNNCTGAAYASLATLASASTSSYTDSNRGSSLNGHWYCYEVMSTSTSASNWKTPLVLPAVQLGLAATQLAISNGGTASVVDDGDTIAITFNQAPNLSNQTGIAVCTYVNGVILIGDSSGGSCTSSSDSYSIGKLTDSNGVLGSVVGFSNSSLSVSGSTATLTLGGGGIAVGVTGTPTWTFTPSSSILSQYTTDQASACTSTTTTCQPTVASSF